MTRANRPVPVGVTSTSARLPGGRTRRRAGRCGQVGAVLGDLYERVPLQAERQHPGDAGVDDPPALRRLGTAGMTRLVLAVDQHQRAFAALHASRRGLAGTGAVGSRVMSLTSSTRSSATGRAGPPSTISAPASPPETWSATVPWWWGWYQCVPGRVVGGDRGKVVERGAGVDPEEGVVAVGLRGDAQPVGVQVGGLVEPVGQPDGELVAGAHPQGRTGGAGVVPQRAGVAAGQPDARGAATSSICSLPSRPTSPEVGRDPRR